MHRPTPFLALVLFAAAFATSAMADEALPPAGTMSSPIRIWVDQIGYRTHGGKMAVVASDAALPADMQFELRDEKSAKALWKSKDDAKAFTLFNGGNKDGDSGDFVGQLDFSAFVTPGRYCLVLTGASPVRSYLFNINDNPHRDAGIAAWKGFYYNRADGEKPEKYGGQWNHGKAFLGPNQATEAKVFKWKTGNRWPDLIGTEVVDPKTYDVHGWWWDAGDFNKYTSNTVGTHDGMLLIYQLAGGAPKDKEFNIPESGNGFPDMLDEIRVGTEFLIRDHDGTGAAFGRVHQESGSPPESVTLPVQLTMPNSETTMGRAAALAYAALVWRESRLDEPFAKKCLDESMRSWDLLKSKPPPWPTAPGDATKIMSQGEMRGDQDFPTWKTTAAACYFRLTAKKEYDDTFRELAAKTRWGKGEGFPPDEEYGYWPAMWVYIHTKDADPALVANIKKSVLATADGTVNMTGGKRGYGMAIRGYWWGSNSTIGRTGGLLVMAAQLTDDKDKKKAYIDAAEEYVHYLYGRNPRGQCYFTNMKSFGVEHSSMVMFHGWVGRDGSPYGAKYIGEGEGKIGPFPGYVIGGPNGNMKKLVEVLDWRQAPWEYNEPDICYQGPCCQLLLPFTWPTPPGKP